MLDENTIDWDALRAQSLCPGGFGKERTRVWPALLGVHVPSEPPPYTEISPEPSADDVPHPDERQVRLDTDRSFVMYPADDSDQSRRTALQSSLNSLIVSLLRKRRKLHYFQGYHDIVTVVFLTLPPELQLPCVEKLSLHRVRDSMGPTLEPVLGLLRIMRNLLRIIDPKYAMLLESIAPLPFHALSNLLTLFSHEVPTLPLIQHVWDFLLCREPLAVVWLAVAVILVRKPDVYQLAVEDEDGMIHSVLNALPPLSDDSETTYDVPSDSDQHTRTGSRDEEDKVTFNTEEAKRLSDVPDENTSDGPSIGQHQMIEQKPIPCLTENGASQNIPDDQVIRGESDMAADADYSAKNRVIQRSDNSYTALSSAQPRETEECPATISSETHIDNTAKIDTDTDFVQLSQPRLPPHPHFPSRPPSPTLLRTSRSSSRTASRSPSPPPPKSCRPPISLPSLLTHAAQLLEAYPPTLPELRVKDILGPKSVVHTWRPPPPREGFSISSDNGCDDNAESWVGSPDVVVPFIEDEDIEESENERKTKSRKGPVTKHRRLILLHRLRLQFGLLTPTEKRILLLGAVAVVGLAVALRQNRGFADMKKGWTAWAWAFTARIGNRTVV
ncbi:rab-GTPase-TBC domain-containing protein [Suillus clintonianus]|uniref:rab-GTPase-TBC domain-containing protein n=1 Tax=Suillus clintonianus TaxID=1904413 RepID=UPI001B862EA2|nr:rab-GTPase-TBC domain-containing protein [Suillus clintonianus]KAG2134829.1 rab-GTPase-TBC domain-containing protein [Suillus clintonianus]